jgi:type II secretory pathway pseudopilin PulG
MKIRCAKRLKAVAAFTLAETVIAIMVLIVTVAGVMNGFGYGFYAIQIARENQRATQIMLETAEIIRLYNWTQVNTPGFIPSITNTVYDPQNPNNPGTSYLVTCSINPYPGTGSSPYTSKIKELIVTCSWTNRVPHTRTLCTLVSENGMQNYVY